MEPKGVIPSAVANVFVRMYYTTMSKEPQLMHRFYSKDSQFLRGDDNTDSQVIVGQTEIYKYLKTVELSRCHARILVIDSQETAHDGISVMVQGEVKYGDGPFRRFMQMFVLMPQGPNKYYVHNDMFRYQDQVFRDTAESEEQDQKEVEEAVSAEAALEPEPEVAPHSAVEEQPQSPEVVQPVPEEQLVVQPEPVEPALPPVEPAAVAEAPAPVPAPAPEPVAPAPVAPERPVEPVPPVKAPAPVKPALPEEPRRQKQEKKAAPPAPSAPRSFANLFKSSPAAPAPAPAPVAPAPPPPVAPAPEQRPAPPQEAPASRGGSARGRGVNGVRRPVVEGEERRRYAEPLPDTHQIFVGNLPTHMNEDDLRQIFDRYGKVADIRINLGKSKSAAGPPKGGAPTPNFGFITFEQPESVKACILEKPICTEAGHRLNVEEKKTRPKEGMGRGGRGGFSGPRMEGGRGRGFGQRRM